MKTRKTHAFSNLFVLKIKFDMTIFYKKILSEILNYLRHVNLQLRKFKKQI